MTGTRTRDVIARSSAVSKPEPGPVAIDRGDEQLAGAEVDRALGPGDGVEPGRLAAALDHDLPGRWPVRIGGTTARASIATTTAWRPNRPAQRLMSVGSATAAVLSETLSAPARRTSRISATRPHAAADGQRDERPPGRPLDDVEQRAAALGRGGDVEEDELVGALRGVALGELGRIALVDEVDEAGALDDAAVGDVEAGDDAAAEHQAARTRSTKLASSRRPSRPLRSGWNWTPSSAPRATADTNARAVVGRGEDRRHVPPSVGHARVRVDEVEVGAVGDAVEERVRARPLDLVPADVREGRRVLEPDRPPGQDAERRRAVLVAAVEQELEPEADAEERAVGRDPGADRLGQAARARAGAIAGAAAPTPGTIERVGAAQRRPRRGRASTSAPTVGQRLVDADEVARRRSRRRRSRARGHASSERALGRGDAVAARVDLAGDAERAAERLERGLGEVMVVAAGAAQVERRAGGPGERLERVLDELERQAAGALAAERQVDDRVRPAADVDDGGRERLVHRHGALAEAGDPGPVAERLGERGAEDERDVLDRVVLVDLEVAVGVDRQVEQAVVGERAEQVVVEADAGVDAGVAGAVEPERDGDLGLVRWSGRRSRGGPRADRSRSRRAASSSRLPPAPPRRR